MRATTRTLLWNTLALLAWAPGCDPVSSNGAPDGGASPSLDAAPDARDPADAPATRGVTYADVTEANLPPLSGLSMDAVAADVDADGDLDLVVAHEFSRNILLLNDGSGRFTDASDRFPDTSRDSEDLAVRDWDGDGALDVLVVSEDDRVNELFLQRDGAFVDASERLPNDGVSNAVAWATLSGDALPTVFVGNNGQNRLWAQRGPERAFVDETDGRLPALEDVTQDLELGDLDGDGDLDLVVGNEGDNLVLFQDAGAFSPAPAGCLPLRAAPEETRDVELGDVDGDGDLDLVFGNVLAFVPGAEPANRLLLNTGGGCFEDASDRWPNGSRSTFDADLVDLDGDGDLDLITANLRPGLSLAADGFRAYINDGSGRFTPATDDLFGALPPGKGFDVEAFDGDGDGDLDLFMASRGAQDRLYLRRVADR
jgi:hypothetical protein